jgi:nucleoside-diphosphate-sugar epimerase
MRVLVTGATGRVGSRLIPRLVERGDNIRVLLRQEADAESFVRRGAEPIIGDLRYPTTLMEAVVGVDAVVHLAAFFRGATEEEARAINQDGTLALATTARQGEVSKFIYISTNLVYGPGRGRAAREDDEPRPESGNFYPSSKLAAERTLTQFYQERRTDLCILRLAFVYGEGDPHLREAINLTRAWPSAKRLQMVHHADVAQAIMLSLDKAQAGGQIYNVADDSPLPISEIRQLDGLSASEIAESAVVSDPWEGIVDTTKIKDELGFHPVYPSLREAEKKGAL